MVLWIVTSGGLFILLCALIRYHRKRQGLYARLAQERTAHLAQHRPTLLALPASAVCTAFATERLIRVPQFVSAETLAHLRAEADASHGYIERSYIPACKQGGTLSYENLHTLAPHSLGMYHAEAMRQWVTAVVGTEVFPTCDHDQSSCVILYYNRVGDHIGWHYDNNFYKGRRFTVLLAVHNQAADGGLSSGNLQYLGAEGQPITVDTSPNVLVLFEGTQVRHCVTPVAQGDVRVMLSMTYCTNPHLGRLQEVTRRLKDVGLYGLRALWD